MANCEKCIHKPICDWCAGKTEKFSLPKQNGKCELCIELIDPPVKANEVVFRKFALGEFGSPYPDGDTSIEACPVCGSGEYLHNEDGNRNDYCGQCGQAIDWGEDDV